MCQPSLDKQDICQLKIDLPKWKPWISQRSWEEWTNFLDNEVSKIQEVPSDPPTWPLQELSTSSELFSEHESNGDECNSGQSTILLEKERQDCTV